MKRPVLLAVAVFVLVAAALASTLRIQPSAHARIIRNGDALRSVVSRVGFVLPGSTQCIVPAAEGLLRFDGTFTVEDAGGESIPTAVRFDYALPARVPAEWSDGTWCASLQARVGDEVRAFLARADVEALRRDPRTAGANAAAALQAQLARWSVTARHITVRPQIPQSALATLPVREIAARTTKTPPVIFIGLDGADWQLLDAYMRAGAMPNLASLVREGTAGNLLTDHPPLSPILWTTMMTGVDPLTHEILDFTRFHPSTGQKEPITSDERKVPAVWNMATQAGKSSAVFGLWATYPAEPVRGLVVSDRFFTFLFSDSKPAPGAVYPPSREAWARKTLAEVENDITFETLRDYLPWLTREQYEESRGVTDPYSQPTSALRRILVETNVYDRLARQYLDSHSPDLTILYLQGTDSIGHVFAPYVAPRQPNISEEDFARYSRVPELYFRAIDRLLGDYKAIAKKRGARLMLASDHGFHWFEDRPTELSSFAASTAAKWHRKAGIYLSWGSGIAASGRTAPEQHLVQIAPKLLSLAGMPGDIAAYRAHFTPAKPRIDAPAPASEELAKLKALGYISGTEATSAPAHLAGKSTHTAGWHNNRGLILKERKQYAAAEDEFRQAMTTDPSLTSTMWNYSDLLHLEKRDLDRSDELLVKAFVGGLPDGRKHLIGRAIGYQRSGFDARSLALLERAVTAKPDDVELRLFRGRYRIDAGDCAGALDDFRVAASLDPNSALPYASAGVAELCLGRNEDARRSFARSLAIDPNQPKLQAFTRGQ